MKPILEYIKTVRGELTHVSWPTTNQAITYTALVIGISVFVAILLGGFDFIFTFGLERILLLKGQ
ncbi:MAG: preprotein translocase subunit SecE [bacterium]|nr:preprotein translocase subunit SecE [bacterium]